MCGRGTCTLSAERCRKVAGRNAAAKVRGAEKLRTRYNLGPSGYVPVVRTVDAAARLKTSSDAAENLCAASEREVCIMRWGLVPSFAKSLAEYDAFKGGSSTFNARVEGVEASGLWRRLVDNKRCVVLFDGFYEWKATQKTKIPMFIRHPDSYEGHSILGSGSNADCIEESGVTAAGGPQHAPLLLAGLYDVWRTGEGGQEEIESAAILTMEPDGTPMMDVHNRMPIFLTPESAALWLDPSAKWKDIIGSTVKSSQLLAQKQLFMYEVSTLVSSIKNESADCILPKKQYDSKQLSKGLGRFFKKADAEAPTSGKRKSDSEAANPTKVAKTNEVIELD